MHPRNKHQDRYDFIELMIKTPELRPHVFKNKFGSETIDFALPEAVKLLNRALLKSIYNINYWDIPPGFLCPPIPGRVDYLHYAADLLAASNHGQIPAGEKVLVWDVGVGANCIYPLVGQHEYGWRFIGSDIDPMALNNATDLITKNKLQHKIELRLQPVAASIFTGIIKPAELIDLTVCNPPFHASAAEAAQGTERKLRNLGLKPKVLNFGGKSNELWCPGGEEAFIATMIEESRSLAQSCLWFTSLVSKKENLVRLQKRAQKAGATQIKVLEMSQGQKTSRVLAWSYLNEAKHQDWAQKRWKEK